MADEHILSQEELDALLGNGEEGNEIALEGHTLGEAFRVVMRSTAEALGRLSGADIDFTVTSVLDSMADLDQASSSYEVLYALSGDVNGNLHLILAQPFVEALVGVLNEEEAGEADEIAEVLAESMQVAGGALRESLTELLSSDVGITVERAALYDPAEAGTDLPADAVAFHMLVRFGDMEPVSSYLLIPEAVADTCMELLMDAAEGEEAPVAVTSFAAAEPVAAPAAHGQSVQAGGPTVSAFRPAEFAPLADAATEASGATDSNLDLLLDVPLRVTVELGRTTMQIRDILDLRKGQVIELDKLAGEPVDVFVNAKLIAKGEVVVMDEHFGVRITHIVSRNERFQTLK